MTYLEIIKSEDFSQIQKIFEDNKPVIDSDTAKAEYFVETHAVNDTNLRPDKTIYKPVINEATGEISIDTSTNRPRINKSSVKVNRVPLPFPEIIVNRRIGFLLGNPVRYDVTYNEENLKEKALVSYVYEIEDSSKSIYKNKEIARRMMSETACAELWYLTEVKDKSWEYVAQSLGFKSPQFELRLRVLSPWLGDNLYPLFDSYGDMIAFARGYKIKEDTKEIEHFDVYTSEMTYKYVNRDSWKIDEMAVGGGKVVNSVSKIPVIYHSQDRPEWANVQKMIERIEKLLSSHGDMNDYFGEPILAIYGNLISAINKGESGKILQLSENAKASFLALESPPESIKMEIENLEKFIFSLSQTPNISFADMKSLGDLSGVALELMFMDAHLAARAKEETLGIGLQRRVNLIKAFIGNVLDVTLSEASQIVKMKPIFTPYMPKNEKEFIETMSQGVLSGILSTSSANDKMEDYGIIPDALQEQERLKEQSYLSSKRNNLIGANFLEQ